jgi:hypothetical protein
MTSWRKKMNEITRLQLMEIAKQSKITCPDEGQIMFGMPMWKCLEQFAEAIILTAKQNTEAKR